jgi:3-phosphoshikimate 1-carboxyvinyltransferase
MTNHSTVVVRPAGNILGSVRLPGDKSISHRYAMLAAIAEGTSHLHNFAPGADCGSTLACLRTLGVKCGRDGNSVVIDGCGPMLKPPTIELDCGNSGSTMRMLSGILAGQSFTSTLTGDGSLSRRPMARIVAPLRRMGARIVAAENERPPLKIMGGELKAIDYKMPLASAQVKSALLFAGLFAAGTTSVEEPARTRDHGEQALRAFGAEIRQDGKQVRIQGRQKLNAIEAVIPGDISSAAFFLCAAALFPGSQLIINELGMNPTRAYLFDLLAGMGLGISVRQVEEKHGELAGTIQAQGGTLRGATIASPYTEMLIDELPVLAAIAPYTADGVDIRDAGELRVKESDRLAAIATNLRALGAEVEERPDGLKICGGQRLHGGEVDALGDHRIAMAFAVAGLRAEGEITIRGADSVLISYPDFFATLESIAQR